VKQYARNSIRNPFNKFSRLPSSSSSSASAFLASVYKLLRSRYRSCASERIQPDYLSIIGATLAIAPTCDRRCTDAPRFLVLQAAQLAVLCESALIAAGSHLVIFFNGYVDLLFFVNGVIAI
jgi:hypothetical protein